MKTDVGGIVPIDAPGIENVDLSALIEQVRCCLFCLSVDDLLFI